MFKKLYQRNFSVYFDGSLLKLCAYAAVAESSVGDIFEGVKKTIGDFQLVCISLSNRFLN